MVTARFQALADAEAKAEAEAERQAEADAAAREAMERQAESEREDNTPTSKSSGPFASCSAARDAGAAPLYQGDPGYSESLDRDGDGVACEN
jgi:hypothetical protein